MEVHIRQEGVVGPLDRNMQQKQKLKQTNNKPSSRFALVPGSYCFLLQTGEQQHVSLPVVILKGRVGWLQQRTADTTLRTYSEDLYTRATVGSTPYKNKDSSLNSNLNKTKQKTYPDTHWSFGYKNFTSDF